ncbi:MAG: DUF4058 family protein [Fibrella sp.]|nr:DUF4058 family protein [Armatimonadota bacterium]
MQMPSHFRASNGLRDRLPALALPPTPDVASVPLDLQAVFDTCYDEAGLGDAVDYTREMECPFRRVACGGVASLTTPKGNRVAKTGKTLLYPTERIRARRKDGVENRGGGADSDLLGGKYSKADAVSYPINRRHVGN